MGIRRKLKIFISLLVAGVLMIAFQNCGYAGPSDPERYMASTVGYSSPPKYSELYSNIFQTKCLTCHSSGSPNFTSYDVLMVGTSVVASNASASTLYQQVSAGLMPKGNSALSGTDVKAIYDWIQAGASSGTAPTPAPDAPTSLAVLATSATTAMLSWSLPSQTVTGVKVERALSSSGPFTTVANLVISTSTYGDTGLTASTTYYYRVSVSNSSGVSPYSNIASVATAGYPPSAPTSLVATVTSSSQIDLSWTDNSSDETSFVVERATSSGGTYSTIATLAANSTSYSSTGLSASTTYYYRVHTANAGGNSADSNTANATTQATITTAPTAPSGLSATAASSSQINLSWTDNSTTETGFKLERGTSSSGPFSLIYTSAANVTSYSDTSLSAATTYYYRVLAYNGSGNSSYTSVANATTQAIAISAPTAPSGLSATATSTTQINLSWTDNSSNESGFKIERGSSNTGPFSLIYTTSAGATSYSNTGLSASTTYYYRISSTNSAGDSSFTSVANATTQASVPTAPSGLSATAASSTQINLSWTDNSSNETGFKVERATVSSGPFSLIATLGSNVTTYSSTGLSTATTYYYRVYAYNSGGNSGYTSTSSAMTFGTYTWVNTNIIQGKCLSCHSGGSPKGGYDVSTYTNVLTRVTSGNAANSLLYQRVLDGTMPKGSPNLTTTELNAIKTWIDGGAQNN